MPSPSRTVERAPSQPARYRVAHCSSAPLAPRSVARTQVLVLLEPNELGLALHCHSRLRQARDQEPLVRVLRKDEEERERAQSLAHIVQWYACDARTCNPQVDRHIWQAGGDHCIGEADLAIELQRAGMDAQRTRRRARFCRLIDDSNAHTQTGQPERQDEARGTRADDEDGRVARHRHPTNLPPKHGSRGARRVSVESTGSAGRHRLG